MKTNTEKRWSIHFGNGETSYLNQDKVDGSIFIFDDVERYDKQNRQQTLFTRSEIADYLKTDDEAFVDSFIKRFGEGAQADEKSHKGMLITAEQARKNLPSKDEILEKYLTEVIEAKIREVSTQNNKTEFSMYKGKEEGKWRFQSLPNIRVWGDEPFDGEKFTNLVISVLKENGYKVKIEVDPETEHYATVYGTLDVSWGEE